MPAINPNAPGGYTRRVMRSGAIVPVSQGQITTGATGSMTAVLRFLAFELQQPATIKALHAYLNVAGGNAKAGIYRSSGTSGLPDMTAAGYSASQSSAVTGNKRFLLDAGALYDGNTGIALAAGIHFAWLMQDDATQSWQSIANNFGNSNNTLVGPKINAFGGATSLGAHMLFAVSSYAAALPDLTGVGEVSTGFGGPTAGASSTPAVAFYPSGVNFTPHLLLEFA